MRIQAIKIMPWGEEIYVEIPLHAKGSQNKVYARHGKTAEGEEYLEVSKFGPTPNTEDQTYSQKLRLHSPQDWVRIKEAFEGELADSIGWKLN